MAVYQALTLRLNPLKMDQIRKKNYIRSKDNQPKYEGGVDKEKRPLSLSLYLSVPHGTKYKYFYTYAR